jgi:hypothetical protein
VKQKDERCCPQESPFGSAQKITAMQPKGCLNQKSPTQQLWDKDHPKEEARCNEDNR